MTTSYITPVNAVASSEFNATYAASKAIDGLTSTYWISLNKTGEQWIRFDLGAQKSVEGIRVMVLNTYTPEVFDVQISDDATSWVTVLPDCTVSVANTWEEKAFAPINGRYIRYYMKSSAGGYYVITETQIKAGDPLLDEYNELGTHTTPPIPTATLPESPRLRFEADTPADTSVTVEYATNNSDAAPPEVWTVAADSDLLTIDGDFLWLRYILATTDTTVTPTLLSVWIEEAEAPPDKIILHFDENNRFNNVESDITVAYNQAIGNLTGTRAVESFSQAFTPLDLEPTQHHQHTISVEGTGVLVDLLPVTYVDSQHEHTISVAGTEVSVTLIHVDDIPP